MSEILIKKQAVKDWNEYMERVSPLIQELSEISQEYLDFSDSTYFVDESNGSHKVLMIQRLRAFIKEHVRDYGCKDGQIQQGVVSSPFHQASASKFFNIASKEAETVIKKAVEKTKKQPEMLAMEVSYQKKKPTFFQKLFGINPGMELKFGDAQSLPEPCCEDCDE